MPASLQHCLAARYSLTIETVVRRPLQNSLPARLQVLSSRGDAQSAWLAALGASPALDLLLAALAEAARTVYADPAAEQALLSMQDLLSLVLSISRATRSGAAAPGAAGRGSASGAEFGQSGGADDQALRAVCSAAVAVQQSGASSHTTLR